MIKHKDLQADPHRLFQRFRVYPVHIVLPRQSRHGSHSSSSLRGEMGGSRMDLLHTLVLEYNDFETDVSAGNQQRDAGDTD